MVALVLAFQVKGEAMMWWCKRHGRVEKDITQMVCSWYSGPLVLVVVVIIYF